MTSPNQSPEPAVPQGEPVAWMHTGGHIQARDPRWPIDSGIANRYTPENGWTPLYTSPARPQNCGTGHCSCIECPYEPVTLTDDWFECKRISELPDVDDALRLFAEGETSTDQAVAIVQTIIAALREKEAS